MQQSTTSCDSVLTCPLVAMLPLRGWAPVVITNTHVNQVMPFSDTPLQGRGGVPPLLHSCPQTGRGQRQRGNEAAGTTRKGHGPSRAGYEVSCLLFPLCSGNIELGSETILTG